MPGALGGSAQHTWIYLRTVRARLPQMSASDLCAPHTASEASGLFIAVMIGWLLLFVPYAMDVMMVARTPGMKSTVPFADLVLGTWGSQ